MKKIVLCIVGIYSFTLLSARTSADSLIAERKDSLRISATSNFSGRLDRFSSSHFYQMTYIGVPLVVGGLIVKSEDDHFRSLRNDYMPRFDRHADDYMQYAPAAIMLGMKVAGVQSRSSWGRMIVSDAFFRHPYGKCGEHVETHDQRRASGWFQPPFFSFRTYCHGIYDRYHVQ